MALKSRIRHATKTGFYSCHGVFVPRGVYFWSFGTLRLSSFFLFNSIPLFFEAIALLAQANCVGVFSVL
jgi:hypothetical protein